MTEGNGRYIDPRLGSLEGEGAQQGAGERSLVERSWSSRPSSTHGDDSTYYELPAIKEPVWIWSVPAYFYVGGAAGAAATLGATAQLIDREQFNQLIVNCRRIAASGTAVGTVFLIIDLGRPERFLNMLRVFRPTSPLSIGSWILATITPLSWTSALLGNKRGRVLRMANAAGLGAGILGPPLAGYTAVLLSNTVVPLWANVRRSLPPLFVASAVSSATSLLGFMRLKDGERRVVDRLEVLASSAELVAAWAVERDAGRDREVGRALKEGLAGRLWTISTACTIAGLGLAVVPGKARVKTLLSSVLGTVGSLSIRFALFHAGKDSAKSPRATFHSQRAGLGAAEVTGRAAVTGPGRRATDATS
jgi:formate-dependent nitrite reductase membrane component NrfD